VQWLVLRHDLPDQHVFDHRIIARNALIALLVRMPCRLLLRCVAGRSVLPRERSDARGGTRKTIIVALARKLLIALWRLVTTGETPAGLLLRAAQGQLSCCSLAPYRCRVATDEPRWRQPDVGLWSLYRGLEWARLLGASPPMRMTASWL